MTGLRSGSGEAGPVTGSRLAEIFGRLRMEKRAGLVTYVTAGDPDLPRSEGILRALDRGGADVIEVVVPFSDPLADGPVIQRATERALAAGTTLASVLDLVARIRTDLKAGLVIFSYANPILRLGAERFADRAKEAGVDGVLVLDLPIEEAGDFRNLLGSRGIDTILLLSPTTSDQRLRTAAASAAVFCTRSRGSVSRACATSSPKGPRRWWRGSGRSVICPLRWVSEFRSRNTCVRLASGPTPRWSAVPL